MKKARLAFSAFNITYVGLISLLYYHFIYCEFYVFPRPKKEARPQPNEEALLSPTTPGAPWTSSSPPLSLVSATHAKYGLGDTARAA